MCLNPNPRYIDAGKEFQFIKYISQSNRPYLVYLKSLNDIYEIPIYLYLYLIYTLMRPISLVRHPKFPRQSVEKPVHTITALTHRNRNSIYGSSRSSDIGKSNRTNTFHHTKYSHIFKCEKQQVFARQQPSTAHSSIYCI